MIPTKISNKLFSVFPIPCLTIDAQDPSFKILDVNDLYVKTTGIPRIKLVGEGLFEVFQENDEKDDEFHELLLNSLKKVINTGENHKMDRLRYDLFNENTGEWEERFWDNENIPIPEDDGSVQYILHCVRDVTEEKISKNREKVAIETLKENQKFLRETQEVAIIGSWDLDLVNNRLVWNKMVKEIHEVSPDYVPELDKAIDFYKTKEDKALVSKIVNEAIEEARSFDVELEILTAKGNEKWVRATGRPEFKDGECTRVYGATQDITTRKITEQRLESINNNIPGVVFRYKLNPDGSDRLMYISKGAEKLWGISAEKASLDNKIIWKLYHKDDLKSHLESIQDSAKHLKEWRHEWRINHPDGTTRWNRGIGTPKKLRDGSIIWDSVILDITVEKEEQQSKAEAEKALEENRVRLNRIMDQSLDVITIIDKNGCFVKTSKASSRLWGYNSKDLEGMPLRNLVHPEDYEKNEAARKAIMAGTPMTNFENRYIAKSGEIIPLIWSVSWDDNEELMYAIARDGRERKEAEQQLKLSEQRFKRLVQDGGDLIAILDQNANYLYTSPNSVNVLGYTSEYLHAKNAWDFIHPEDLERLQESYERLENEKRLNISPFRFKHKNGSWRWLETTATNLLKDPAVQGIVANSRDITEKKYLQDLEHLEKKVLEMSFKKKFSLDDILEYYLQELEHLQDRIWVAIWKLDKNQLLNWILPGLPEELVEEINRSAFSEEFISKMKAEKKPVEINQWPENSKLSLLMKRFEISTVSRFPVLSSSGELLGVFSVYCEKRNIEQQILVKTINRTLGLLQLIIEFKQKEKALLLSNQRYKFVNKATKDAIYDWDITNNNIEWGEGFTKLFGFKRESKTFPIEKWSENVHPEDMEETQRSLNANLLDQKQKKWSRKYRFKNKAGEYILVVENGYILRDSDGVAYRMIGVLRDVTDLYEYEKELFMSDERFKYVTKATSDAIWDWDLEKDEIYWGEGFETLYGYKISELTTDIDLWINNIHPEDMKVVKSSLERAVAGDDKKWEAEYRFATGNGEYKYVKDKGYIVRNKSGKAIRAVGAMQDISRSKEYESSLKSLNDDLKKHAKELEISNTELEQFAYVASHDLQEPLRMVTSFLTQLEKKYSEQLDEKAHTYIHFAVDGAKRMRSIILDLLEFSRVGRTEDKQEIIDVNEIISEVKTLYRKEIEDTGTAIITQNLPEIMAPKSPLRQVFQNLISNAIKYRKESVAPRIEIGVEETNNFFVFRVQDNGIGINTEYFDKIFIIFQRLHQRETYSGTGMGLAVTKKIIENLGGKIWLESKEGKGTIFYFSIVKH
ncbi:PAS domain-containing protein [Salegentibacter sediminis]|uniref:PAS domain-containing protein n=1 Tax=Salegentibacter sediminis TaxID=1930251 RepID=UPI0012FFB4FB|nr:PAS domain-containing protein [Salegentibacter sediminis]